MQELRFQLTHINLSALAFGTADKPLILALHGWLDNAASFIPLAEYFKDYYVVALDLTGHGNSSHRPPGSHYHQLDFVQDLHELIESQGWQPFILLGHSMGGIIASLYASSFTERISHLITIEAFGPYTKEASSSAQQLRESIESRLAASRSKAKHPGSMQSTVEARAKAGDMSMASASLLVERNISHKDGSLYFKTDRRLRTFSSLRMTEEQAEAFMRAIPCPTLVVTGDQGFDSVRLAVTQRQQWIACLTTVECPGHHHLHMDNAASVARSIHTFLSENVANYAVSG